MRSCQATPFANGSARSFRTRTADAESLTQLRLRPAWHSSQRPAELGVPLNRLAKPSTRDPSAARAHATQYQRYQSDPPTSLANAHLPLSKEGYLKKQNSKPPQLQRHYSWIASHLSALSRAASDGGPMLSGLLLLLTFLIPDLSPFVDASVTTDAVDADDAGAWNAFGPEPA